MKTSTGNMRKEQVSWLKRIGMLGFLFFLIKGIFWIIAIWAGFSFF